MTEFHRLIEDAPNFASMERDELVARAYAMFAAGTKTGAENSKLRELVKDFFDVPCQCLKCEYYNYEEDRCDLRDRASELGIEVRS